MNDPVQPAAFGPYRVIRPLGRGGMGHVYEAVGPDGVHVAVKVFMLDHGQVDLLRRRFDAEAKILRRLGRVRDSGAGAEPDGKPIRTHLRIHTQGTGDEVLLRVVSRVRAGKLAAVDHILNQ